MLGAAIEFALGFYWGVIAYPANSTLSSGSGCSDPGCIKSNAAINLHGFFC